MADDVPVYDILSEAMEYLSKLGSNLRVRSENLKDRKIRRDRLKNSHAVQKAANKVLLICELSKKSLENVESGVKKVLSFVEAAQAVTSEGSQRSPRASTKSEARSINEHYFEYQSQRLRIAKKIPLKHFLSVKVQARNMPQSFQDKYPVYHNCKLYRLRKRLEKPRDVSESRTADNQRIEIDEVDQVEKDMNTSKCISDSDVENGKDSVKLVKDVHNENIDKNNVVDDKEIQSRVSKCCDNEIEGRSRDSDSPNFRRNNKKRRSTIVLSDDEPVHDLPHLSSSTITDKETTQRTSECKDMEEERLKDSNAKDNTKKKKRKRSVIQSNDEDSDNLSDSSKRDNRERAQRSESNIDDKINQEQVTNDISDNNEKDVQLESNSIVIKQGQNSDDDANEKHVSKKIKLSDPHDSSDVDNKENKNLKHIDSDHQSDSQSEAKSETSKPLIKCVSIAKLLKPDVLEKIVDKSYNKKGIKTTETSRTSKNKKNNSGINVPIKRSPVSTTKGDEDYWNKKREEVKSFKPKKFVINVTKLPKNFLLPVNFLTLHGLKRIVQSNMIICELPPKIDNVSNRDSIEKNCTSEPVNTDLNIVKNSLLNDSDSDQQDLHASVEISDESKKVKNALLNESDSESNTTKDKTELEGSITQKQKKENHGGGESEKGKKTKTKSNVLETDKAEKSAMETDQSKKVNEQGKQLNEGEENIQVVNKSFVDDTADAEKNDTEMNQSSKDSGQADNDVEKKLDTLKENAELPQSSPKNTDEIKSALLNSSDDNTQKTPDKQRKQNDKSTTPRSKRKHIMESMHAKKMLLTYSSSSETEDEQLRGVLKEIKDSLLKGLDSSEEEKTKRKKTKHRKKILMSSDSDENTIKEKFDEQEKSRKQKLDRSSQEKSDRDSNEKSDEGSKKKLDGDNKEISDEGSKENSDKNSEEMSDKYSKEKLDESSKEKSDSEYIKYKSQAESEFNTETNSSSSKVRSK